MLIRFWNIYTSSERTSIYEQVNGVIPRWEKLPFGFCGFARPQVVNIVEKVSPLINL